MGPARANKQAAQATGIAFPTLVAALLLIASGCAQDEDAANCAADFETRLAEAEGVRAEAAAAGSEWLETGSLLSRAGEEAAAGNIDAACRLLEEARFQAAAAIEQARREAAVWADRVVK